MNRALLGFAIAGAVALFVPAVFGKPDLNPWNAFSILMIFASYGLFQYLDHGNRGAMTKAIMVGLILFDLSAFDWTARNRIEVAKNGVDHYERILSARGAAEFLKAQPGTFRVRVQADPTPNIGDLFEVPLADNSGGATLPTDYARIMSYPDLLNVRYILTAATEQKPGAVYQDRAWKVYENLNAYPRAWTVHETIVEPSAEHAAVQVGASGFDARRTAFIETSVDLEPLASGLLESAVVSLITPNHMEIQVDMQSRGLLVLSENYYPGWRATVNGEPAAIYRVDSALRGVIVPRGPSRVTLNYAPASVYWGGLLTAMAFLGTLGTLGYNRYRDKR